MLVPSKEHDIMNPQKGFIWYACECLLTNDQDHIDDYAQARATMQARKG